MKLYLYDLYWATELSLLDCHLFDEKIAAEIVTSIFVKVIFVGSYLWSRMHYQIWYAGTVLLNEHAIKNEHIMCEYHNFEQNKSLKPPA